MVAQVAFQRVLWGMAGLVGEVQEGMDLIEEALTGGRSCRVLASRPIGKKRSSRSEAKKRTRGIA